MLATYAVLWRLDRSWFGRACRAVRDNPEAAAAMGMDVARTKVIAFTLTSALAGVAGMVYAFVDNTVNPPIFGLENAFLLLFMVIVGGAGRHAGAVHRRGAAVPAAVLALAAGRTSPCCWCSACSMVRGDPSAAQGTDRRCERVDSRGKERSPSASAA